MYVLLVICESSDEPRRSKIQNLIKKRYKNSMALSGSLCAIYTSLLPVRVYDELKPHVASDDQLYVIPLSKPYTGYGPRKVTEWLSDYLST